MNLESRDSTCFEPVAQERHGQASHKQRPLRIACAKLRIDGQTSRIESGGESRDVIQAGENGGRFDGVYAGGRIRSPCVVKRRET